MNLFHKMRRLWIAYRDLKRCEMAEMDAFVHSQTGQLSAIKFQAWNDAVTMTDRARNVFHDAKPKLFQPVGRHPVRESEYLDLNQKPRDAA